jgi:hypothetical protein
MDMFKFYDNIVNPNCIGNLVSELSKLNEGQIYVINIGGQFKCGPLVKFNITVSPPDKTNWYNLYFCVGMAKYDDINMQDQINEFHYQENCSHNIEFIYEYHLDKNIQEDLQNYIHFKKIYKMCVKNLDYVKM